MRFARFFKGLDDKLVDEGSSWRLTYGELTLRARVGLADPGRVLLAISRDDEWRLSDRMCAKGTEISVEVPTDDGIIGFKVEAIGRGADETRSLYVTRPENIAVIQRRGGNRSTVLLNAWVRSPEHQPPGDEALLKDLSLGGARLLVHELTGQVAPGDKITLILEGPGIGKAEVSAEIRRLLKRVNGTELGLALLPDTPSENEVLTALVARIAEAKTRQSG